MFNKYFIGGCLFWGCILFCLFRICLNAELHDRTLEVIGRKERIQISVCIIVLIVVCAVPMKLTPFRDAAYDSFSKQYEYMAEAILDGRLYLDYGDMDDRLLEMDNPYDPAARTEAGVTYHWDHALYNGHYYMYFGIVPVLLLFLPFRAITGMSLDTLYATRIFVAVFICGVFAVFYLLAIKFFKQMTKGMYLLMSSAFAMMSIWYSIDAPILYCTAITSALCMEIWSLFFFIKAVWMEEDEKKRILYAFCGSICGALAFGCRPPVALANILVLPMLGVYLRDKKADLKLIRQLAFAASPYIVTAVLLMAYNYARFDNPFEFGQRYQLTLADQSGYTGLLSQFDVVKIWNGILENFLSYNSVRKEFPFISCNGVWFNFPILLFGLIGLTHKEVRAKIKMRHLGWFVGVLFLLPVIITAADVIWSPFLMERYRMDIYWLLGVSCFLVTGFYYMNLSNLERRKCSYWMTLWAFATICICMLLVVVPYDGNFTMDAPEKLEEIRRVLSFGKNF